MDKKRLKNYSYLAILIALIGYLAYAKGWILTNFESITPQQAHQIIQSGEKVTILDVRSPDEYTEEHIEGSILIPLQTLDKNLGLIAGEKSHKIIVYCRSGARSVSASRLLANNGFTPLNVKGGISEWKAQGLNVTR